MLLTFNESLRPFNTPVKTRQLPVILLSHRKHRPWLSSGIQAHVMPHHCRFPVHLKLHLSVFPVLCWYHDPHVFCVSGSRQKENSPLVQTLLLAGRGERWGADGALGSPGLHASVSIHWPGPVGWPSLTMGWGSQLAPGWLLWCCGHVIHPWGEDGESLRTVTQSATKKKIRNFEKLEFAHLRLNRIVL